jgi:pyridoxine 4-dehydrogenase
LRALERTPAACGQNQLRVVGRASTPVLDECLARGIAFVPFFPLGSGFIRPNPVLGNKYVVSNAKRLGITAAQVALAWTLGLAPNILLIPGTSPLSHLEENLAVADLQLDDQARQELTAAAA